MKQRCLPQVWKSVACSNPLAINKILSISIEKNPMTSYYYFLYAESVVAHELLSNDINCNVFPWQTVFWYRKYNNMVDYDIIKNKSMVNSNKLKKKHNKFESDKPIMQSNYNNNISWLHNILTFTICPTYLNLE